MRKKIITCISGGLDSSVLVHWISKNIDADIYTVAFNYGQRHSRELDCAEFQSKSVNAINHKLIDLRFLSSLITNSALTNTSIDVPSAREVIGDPQNLSYVPNRNMIMLSILAGYAESVGATDIYYGAQNADRQGYWDCTPEFLQSINDVLHLNYKNQIEIKAPFVDWDKTDIINVGVELRVDFKQTHTCYNGTEVACGKCVSDANRIQAFLNAGYIDPVKYAVDIPWHDYNCKSLPYTI